MITVLAPAKINLFLRVCGKTDAGYHQLDSLVVFTAFGDQLMIEPAQDDQLMLTGDFAATLNAAPLNGAGDNLVMRALNGFRDAGGVIGGLSITLEKNIPVGAGLGGGSADAAALLRAVNQLSAAPLSNAALYRLAASLGADLPVCLAGGCQRIAGIGDRMTSVDLPPIGALLLANPGIPLSTKDVFTQFTGPKSGFAGSLANLDAVGMVGLGNDLTLAALALAPEIKPCLDLLAGQAGAMTASMSGSGASCFALFDHLDNAKTAAATLATAGYWARASQIYHSV